MFCFFFFFFCCICLWLIVSTKSLDIYQARSQTRLGYLNCRQTRTGTKHSRHSYSSPRQTRVKTKRCVVVAYAGGPNQSRSARAGLQRCLASPLASHCLPYQK
uniref:Putative secreted protein n=1 Tax=Rhipicephalus microplus TaxID=6941 RepID=A0A6M2D9Q8_RHIMP